MRNANVEGEWMSGTGDVVDVDVVIVTYAAAAYIGDCLASIAASEGVRCRVWVVDNDSHDDTVARVRRDHPTTQVVEQRDNVGFGVSTNVGIRAGSAPYVLALNPDTVLEPTTVVDVLAAMAAHPEVGVAGCRLVRQDGSLDHAAKRGQPSLRSGISYLLHKAGLPVGSAYLAPEVGPLDTALVGAVNGAFMLMRRDVLDVVGLFDERYWMYAEDLDLCRRFTDAGHPVLYVGSTACTHLKGAASGTHRSLKLNWHFHHSMALYYAKFDAKNPVARLLVTAGIYARFVLSAVSSSVRRRLG
ncbi:MAG: glycosyl transferase family 2 [Nocardioidaceae bacterium]|nr:glycosyl transferase family 2 [Nocardioidaceae bacterium]